MLLIALEGNDAQVVTHAAAYLRETYGFITLKRSDLTATEQSAAAGLEAFLTAFTISRHRKVTKHEEAREVGRQLRYKPNTKGRATAVPLGFEYYEDHAGIIVLDTFDADVWQKVRENDGGLWYIRAPGVNENAPLQFLRTGDKLILHNAAPERLNTALSMALGGESVINTIDDTPEVPVAGPIAHAVREAANEV